MFENIHFLNHDTLKIQGITDNYVKFVVKDRLKDKSLWQKLVQPFYTREDSLDGRWRGEFFGKEMRGASLVYRYTGDKELYNILEDAVKDILSAQDDEGRIATYEKDNEFFGWDMWCRKYVLTGLLHFYDICENAELKETILATLQKHADYIISKIGEGKKKITETSKWWGCVNSCTVLEPILALYKKTNKQEYLKFAEYIISTGGSSDCNFLQLALENKFMPYQYPVVKAYETMSFFEGLLAYYEISGEEKFFRAVNNFIEAVTLTDITIIGCAGCTHELFDNSYLKQTEFSDQIMQETCVTVTYIRLLSRMFFLTGESKYIDRIEKSGFNALYGSLNTHHSDQCELESKEIIKAMTFDSYSPLYLNSRGRGIGGFMKFKGGGHCGCCVSIASCGIALMPLMSALQENSGTIINYLFNGEIKTVTKDKNEIILKIKSDYPTKSTGEIVIESKNPCKIGLFIRIPDWSKKIAVNGKEYTGDYADLSGEYKAGQKLKIEYFPQLSVHRLNKKVAFTYGAITLATDEEKRGNLSAPVDIEDKPVYKILKAEEGEIIRLEVPLKNGEKLLLADYQSCGKNWSGEKNKLTVWFNT